MLKTMMKVFDGDADMFHRVRLEVRQKIYEYKDEKEVTQIQNRIFFGEEARDFLTNNILKAYNLIDFQGKLQQNGRYRFKAQA